MTKPTDTERRLIAIFAADVEGYSRLMEVDEVATLRDLTERRQIMDALIAAHRGRIANTAGDSVLAEFGSAVDAIQCAVEAQAALAKANAGLSSDRHINFRIGVHVGDVMVKDGDLFGDSVNIAARLQTLAMAGGILISSAAHDHVRKILPYVFADVGAQQVKNMEEPVRAFALQVAGDAGTAASRSPIGPSVLPLLGANKSPPLPDKPSIAVLPFQNMSGDPEQEYFADGVVEEIITALSRFQHLFVIARNSSFTYKGRAVEVKQIGRELGVRYVLEGSVRKAANRVRITGQLIDASTGAHLWADRFEGELEDIFDLQDKVTASVVGAVAPRVELAEIERAQRKPTENLNAYDHYLRGMASFYQGTAEATSVALDWFYQAIELDPAFASAYGMAARCYTLRKVNGWRTNEPQELVELERLARRAVKLGKDDAFALCTGGFALAHLGDLEEGAACIDRAAMLNPSLAWAWNHGGWVSAWRGEPEEAIQRLTHAMRLSPLDPLTYRGLCGIAFSHFLAGRYDEACVWGEKALLHEPNFVGAIRVLAASYAMAGRHEQAKKAIARLHQLYPAQRISNLKEWATFRRPEHFTKWVDALRAAGLPE